MSIAPSPTTASVVAQPPESMSSNLSDLDGNVLDPRRGSHITEKSSLTKPYNTTPFSRAPRDATSLHSGPSTSKSPPPSQQTQLPPSQEVPPETQSEISPYPAPEIFVARDFAYKPRPEIPPVTVDEKWVVNLNIPKNPVPGLRERMAEQWEAEHSRLYRLQGNRADPPGKFPKTWGGRSKSEDEELTRQAEQRALAAERMKISAAALGFTPTEPNLLGPPLPEVTQVFYDRELAALADEFKRQREAEAIAAGEPFVKTPSNSPPPERRRRGFPPPPPPPPEHHATSPSQEGPSVPGRSKRKLDEPTGADSEHVIMERGRKRRQWQLGLGTTNKSDSSTSPPQRYSLRQRQPKGGTKEQTPSPKSYPKRKEKSKGKA